MDSDASPNDHDGAGNQFGRAADRGEIAARGRGRFWLLLDAIPPMEAARWIDSLRNGGGGLVASTSLLNVTRENRETLSRAATGFVAAR
eukprot:3217964-Rhodomonas_salina.1